MEVILKQDINNLGQKDDIVNVKDGYASNFLIPKGYAINATSSARKIHAETMRQRAHKEAKIREEAKKVFNFILHNLNPDDNEVKKELDSI